MRKRASSRTTATGWSQLCPGAGWEGCWRNLSFSVSTSSKAGVLKGGQGLEVRHKQWSSLCRRDLQRTASFDNWMHLGMEKGLSGERTKVQVGALYQQMGSQSTEIRMMKERRKMVREWSFLQNKPEFVLERGLAWWKRRKSPGTCFCLGSRKTYTSLASPSLKRRWSLIFQRELKLINATYFIEHQLSLRPDTGVRIWQDIWPVAVITMVYSTYY